MKEKNPEQLPFNREYYNKLARRLKSLAHPTRLFIVLQQVRKPLCVCDLAERIGDDISTISKHITLLKNAGILQSTRDGQKTYYKLRVPCVLDYISCFQKSYDVDEQLSPVPGEIENITLGGISMTEEKKGMENWNLLPHCGKEAEGLDIILACDGAASVGQVGHQVAVDLTNRGNGARMCCLSAVAADSPAHVGIARKARKLIAINGCTNRCASKILEQKGIPYDYEVTISELGVKKVATLDFNRDDVVRIAEKISKEALTG